MSAISRDVNGCLSAYGKRVFGRRRKPHRNRVIEICTIAYERIPIAYADVAAQRSLVQLGENAQRLINCLIKVKHFGFCCAIIRSPTAENLIRLRRHCPRHGAIRQLSCGDIIDLIDLHAAFIRIKYNGNSVHKSNRIPCISHGFIIFLRTEFCFQRCEVVVIRKYYRRAVTRYIRKVSPVRKLPANEIISVFGQYGKLLICSVRRDRQFFIQTTAVKVCRYGLRLECLIKRPILLNYSVKVKLDKLV